MEKGLLLRVSGILAAGYERICLPRTHSPVPKKTQRHRAWIWLLAVMAFGAVPTANARQLTVAWDDNAADETGFKIERSTDGLLFAQIATVGAGVTTYVDTSVTSQSYWYRVRAYNATTDSAYSNVAEYINTDAAPTFSTQPTSQSVASGSNVSFTVAASGSPVPTFQWKKDDVTIVGATSTTLTLNGVTSADAGSYTVVATNSVGSTTSSAASLTVAAAVPTGVAPTITTQPAGQVVNLGGTATFSVVASGSPVPTYQWRKDGTALSGAVTETLTLTSVSSANTGTYTVVVTNASGSVTSSGAVLALAAATTTTPPTGATPPSPNTPANDTTSSSSNPPASDTTPSSPKTDVSETTNTTPNTTTDTATPTVDPKPTATAVSRLTNASIRAIGGQADQTLIIGFVVGDGNKSVMIRAVGPGLSRYTSAATFTDPKLTIFDGSKAIAANDNWGGGAELRDAFTKSGAFSLTNDSKDAALLTTLGPKGYTVQVNGTGAGMALAEIYDMDSTGGRLINVSARARVGAGDSVLIAGFVIAGNAPKQVLIRATGPALESFGVSGVLASPQLTLYRGSAVVAQNEGWGGTNALVTAFNQTGAFPLADPGSKDAALLVTLEPGPYSAIVSGANGSTGVALIEVYEVP